MSPDVLPDVPPDVPPDVFSPDVPPDVLPVVPPEVLSSDVLIPSDPDVSAVADSAAVVPAIVSTPDATAAASAVRLLLLMSRGLSDGVARPLPSNPAQPDNSGPRRDAGTGHPRQRTER
jgi:hypothetical protein